MPAGKSIRGISKRAPPPPRKKSCTPCRASKARCDLSPNGCSRCLVKGLDCQYPGQANSAQNESGVNLDPSTQRINGQRSLSNSLDNVPPVPGSSVPLTPAPSVATAATFDMGMSSGAEGITGMGEIGGIGGIGRDGLQELDALQDEMCGILGDGDSGFDPDFGLDLSVSAELNEQSYPPFSWAEIYPPEPLPEPEPSPSVSTAQSLFSSPHATTPTTTDSLTSPSRRYSQLSNPSITSSLDTLLHTNDIIHAPFVPPWEAGHFLYTRFHPSPATTSSSASSRARRSPDTPPSVIESLMTITLRSYPNMMADVERRGLPPFIHRSQRRRRALANCASLVGLWKAQRKWNGAFVRESLERERERIFSEYRNYDELEMLSALQAVTIYSVLEYLDPYTPPEELPAGYPRVTSILEMAYYVCRPGIVCHTELIGGRPRWEDWILVESRRRLCVVLFLLDSLSELHQGHSITVCPDISELPLPSSRKLWEAPDRSAWEAEYARRSVGERPRVMRELWGLGARDERLDAWVAEMDLLGGAVLAISICAAGGG